MESCSSCLYRGHSRRLRFEPSHRPAFHRRGWRESEGGARDFRGNAFCDGRSYAQYFHERDGRIIRRGDSIILDARPRLEWAISHIPTAVNVAPKPGTSISLYVSDVAEIDRIVGGDKHKPVVLYCNGPFCGKSKRLAGELAAAGYANVRRYQLGAPVWRALGK